MQSWLGGIVITESNFKRFQDDCRVQRTMNDNDASAEHSRRKTDRKHYLRSMSQSTDGSLRW